MKSKMRSKNDGISCLVPGLSVTLQSEIQCYPPSQRPINYDKKETVLFSLSAVGQEPSSRVLLGCFICK